MRPISVRLERLSCLLVVFALVTFFVPGQPFVGPAAAATARPVPQEAAVLQLHELPASRAAEILRSFYPAARVRVDATANAVIVVGPPADVEAMRTIVQGIDVKNPAAQTADVISLHAISAAAAERQLQPLFPGARFAVSSKTSLVVRANATDMAQIKALAQALDVPTGNQGPAEAIHISSADARRVARTLQSTYPRTHASVSGTNVILAGPSEDVDKAKQLAQSLDVPPPLTVYTQIYRLQHVDSASVADLIARAFPAAKVTVDRDLNAISVTARQRDQDRIAAGIAQLDGTGTDSSRGQGASAAPPSYGDGNFAIVDLESALPGTSGAASTTASDIATTVTNLLGPSAPNLRISVEPGTSRIALMGDPESIRLAKDVIAKLDRSPPLVVLDTEILEVDETTARNLGLTLSGAISSTFTEITPAFPSVVGPQPLSRSALSFSATLNLLVTEGQARVLADPRITTLSGHSASIHAGDNISILTQTAGGVGTPVTSQVQTFNTGVSLDITPMVGPGGSISVALHPVVNSVESIDPTTHIPNIATRDTQTLVNLRDNETLVIGGLIQETRSRATNKIPVLGEIPVIGKLFDSSSNSFTRNELIIVVTPHILAPGESIPPPSSSLKLGTPAPLPTLLPGTSFPSNAPPVARRTPAPVTIGPVLSTPMPTASPAPAQTPVAFASANVFQYGSPPQNAYAGPSDLPQIFYATLSPTVVKTGTQVTVSAITTTNVGKVTITYGTTTVTLSKLGTSTWQASFPFNATGTGGQSSVQLTLNAYRGDGAQTQIQIPVNVLAQS